MVGGVTEGGIDLIIRLFLHLQCRKRLKGKSGERRTKASESTSWMAEGSIRGMYDVPGDCGPLLGG